MEKMVCLLYEKETIFKEEVEALFAGASVESILHPDEAAAEPTEVPEAPADPAEGKE